MKFASLSKVTKQNLGLIISNTMEVIDKLTIEGVVVYVFKCSETGKQVISIDGSGDEVILVTS